MIPVVHVLRLSNRDWQSNHSVAASAGKVLDKTSYGVGLTHGDANVFSIDVSGYAFLVLHDGLHQAPLEDAVRRLRFYWCHST